MGGTTGAGSTEPDDVDADSDAGPQCAPVRGTWTSAESMTTRRVYPMAVLLQSGAVLVAGGIVDMTSSGTVYTNSAELYDPVTGHGGREFGIKCPRVLLPPEIAHGLFPGHLEVGPFHRH